jgi:D-3-phosphoglycerate dehydrogenase
MDRLIRVGVLHNPGCKVEVVQDDFQDTRVQVTDITYADSEEMVKKARNMDILATRADILDKKVLQALPECKYIAYGGMGVVPYIDVAEASRLGIIVSNIPDAFVEEVSNHTFMFLLASARRLRPLDSLVRSGQWEEKKDIIRPIGQLVGQTLGLLAFGNIARAVAQKGRAFGLRCIAYDPYFLPREMERLGVRPASFEEVFRKSDYVSCHLPLNEETEGIIGYEQFAMMKKTGIFINTSRGGVLRERDLVRALREGIIAGAALDVFSPEPPRPNSHLFGLENILLTPHAAAYSDGADERSSRGIVKRIRQVLNGDWPDSIVNREVLGNSRLERVRLVDEGK